MSARERDGIMVGTGAGLALIVLLVLRSFTGNGLFGTSTLTITVTTLPIRQVAEAVASGFATHMLLTGSRNVTAAVGQYEGNATVTWTGNEGPNVLQSPATNADAITRGLTALFYQPCGSYDTVESFAISDLALSTTPVSDGSAMVNSTFVFLGNSTLWGSFNATVSSQDLFVYRPTARHG